MSRIAGITLALAGIGAIVGCLLGVLTLTLIGLTQGINGVLDATVLFPVAGGFGAIAGAVLAPIASWSLMRRVPIWRAIAGTAAGTLLGAVIGYGLGSISRLGIFCLIIGGLLGFITAAIRLRVRRPKSDTIGVRRA